MNKLLEFSTEPKGPDYAPAGPGFENGKKACN